MYERPKVTNLQTHNNATDSNSPPPPFRIQGGRRDRVEYELPSVAKALYALCIKYIDLLWTPNQLTSKTQFVTHRGTMVSVFLFFFFLYPFLLMVRFLWQPSIAIFGVQLVSNLSISFFANNATSPIIITIVPVNAHNTRALLNQSASGSSPGFLT